MRYGKGVHKSFGSPASVGASKGPGPLPGAGELPPRGPGAAAAKYARNTAEADLPVAKTPGVPSGISNYSAGNPPPRGYKQ